MTPTRIGRTPRRRVALLVETSLASGRDILRGIARFVREHEPWVLLKPFMKCGTIAPAQNPRYQTPPKPRHSGRKVRR